MDEITYKRLEIMDCTYDILCLSCKTGSYICEGNVADVIEDIPCHIPQDVIIDFILITGNLGSIEDVTEFFQIFYETVKNDERLREVKIFYVLGAYELYFYNLPKEAYRADHRLEMNFYGLYVLVNQVIPYSSCLILGSVGFARHGDEITVQQCEWFYMVYKQTLRRARILNCPIVIVTHTPVSSWLPDGENLDHQCICFYQE